MIKIKNKIKMKRTLPQHTLNLNRKLRLNRKTHEQVN